MSIPIVDSVFMVEKLTQVKSHTIHYGEIKDKNCNIIDDVLVSVFRALILLQEKILVKYLVMETHSLLKKCCNYL